MSLKMYSEPEKQKITNIKNTIAIAAGKGGVGKSTVTVNLALALKNRGFSVGIMDTDIYGPSIRKMIPENKLPTQKDKYLIPADCNGIPLISMAFFRPEHEASAVRAPIANNIIMQFIQQVAWGELDYLLIDYPPGTGDIQLTLSQKANVTGAIMVTTPQEISLMDVRKAINLFDQVKIPLIGIVENMSYYYHIGSKERYYLFGKGGGEKLAQEMETYLLETIPIHPLFSEFGDMGKSLFAEPENDQIRLLKQHYLSLADKVVQHCEEIRSEGQTFKEFDLSWKEAPTS